MSGSSGSVVAVPTGGAALISMPGYFLPASGITFMSLSRAVSGASGIGPFATFYSGAPLPVYVDAGDGTPAPLFPGSTYLWNVTDDTGTVQLGPVTPSSTVVSKPDYLTNVLIRLIQGALNSATFPSGVKLPQVTTRMPQQGYQALPFVVVNLDLIQQTETQIGEDVPNPIPPDNSWVIWSNAKRIWCVSVFSADPQERDWLRDSILSFFRVLKATVFAPIGYNVSHSFQAVSGTDAKEWEGHTPGFYYADLMLELDGVFITEVSTNYGLIEQIDVNATVLPDIENMVIENIEVNPTYE
jgi:hypothetical protein